MTLEILSYEDFILKVIAALDAVGVEHLIGGAVAVWAWGEPRSTLDLDMVVKIPIEKVDRLSEELEKQDFLIPAEFILDAILETQADLPINAIHMYSGYKVVLYPLRAGDELRASAFERRVRVDLGPPLGEVYLHSPEDLIIYKLWYFSFSQQTRHIRDITSIVLALEEKLDTEYIRYWVDQKGLASLWNELLAQIHED